MMTKEEIEQTVLWKIRRYIEVECMNHDEWDDLVMELCDYDDSKACDLCDEIFEIVPRIEVTLNAI